MKILLVLSILIGLTFAQDILCRGVKDNNFLLGIISCSQFYECIGGRALKRTCTEGQSFDSRKRKCDDSENANCETSLRNAEACGDQEQFEFFPSESSCQEYYQCIDNVRWLAECPRGLYFDSETSTCLPPSEANCAASPPDLPPTEPDFCEDEEQFQFFPSETSCHEYYQCIDNVRWLAECPRGLYFDSETLKCLPPSEANCAASPPDLPPVDPDFCEDEEQFKFFPSESSCHEYYQCIDNVRWLAECPRGLYFDSESLRCLPPSEANCAVTAPPDLPPVDPDFCEDEEQFQFFPSESSCHEYYQCIDNVRWLAECPRGLYFDSESLRCLPPSEANCAVTTTNAPPTTTTEEPPSIPSCENVADFQRLRSPASCTLYYVCLNEIAFLLSCPRGLYFSEMSQTCVYPTESDCVTVETSTINVPPLEASCEGVENNRLIEHPTSCALFYRCVNEIGVINSCPVGRYFDVNSQGCADSDLVDCGERTRRPTTTTVSPIEDPQCRGVEDGRFVFNINSCTSYYQCIDGRAMPRFCEDNLWFDEELQGCDVPENVNCAHNTIPTAPTLSPNFLCENVPDETYVPSPSYCERFYYCFNGIATPNTCQDGLWFDRESQGCRPSNEVECTLPTLPTSTTPMTTTDFTPSGLCREARNGTYVSNHMACGEYFVCIDGEPHGRVCQEGLWFSLNQQRCTTFTQVSCELDPIVCLGVGEDDVVRLPASCSEFLTCVDGIPYPGRCFNDDYFNEETGRCDSRSNVQCDLEVPEEPRRGPCDGGLDFGLVRHDERCNEFFVCYHNEILFSLECPENQVFNFEQQVCGENFECLL